MIPVGSDEKDPGARLPEVLRPDQGMDVGVASPYKNQGRISREIHDRLRICRVFDHYSKISEEGKVFYRRRRQGRAGGFQREVPAELEKGFFLCYFGSAVESVISK